MNKINEHICVSDSENIHNRINERVDKMDNEAVESIDKTERKKRRTVKEVEADYKAQIEALEVEVSKWKELYYQQQEANTGLNKRLQDIEQRHIDDIKELADELEHFKQWKMNMAKGGRKQMLSEAKKQQIIMMRDQRKTIRQIAEHFGVSVGLVHKVLKEKGYTW